jgi:hypothetical protein
MFGEKYKRNEWFQHPVCLQANMRLSITFCTQTATQIIHVARYFDMDYAISETRYWST